MARPLAPRQGETLAAFLDRAIEQRKKSINGLARELAEVDGSSSKTWQRTLRRWGQGAVISISPENADTVGSVLTADLSSFVAQPTPAVRDLLTQALERIEHLEGRVAALERP